MQLSIVLRRSVGSGHELAFPQRLSVGRGPENDLVIPNPHVSWTHAVLWREGSAAFVQDLGTRNGTFLDDKPVHDRMTWAVGSVVRIGDAELRLENRGAQSPSRRTRMALEDQGSGVRYPLRTARFTLGAGPDSTVLVPNVETTTLLSRANGEVWLAQGDDEERLLREGEEFCVGRMRLRLVSVGEGWMPTMSEVDEMHPYLVEATLGAPGGPQARIVDTRGGSEVLVTAPNRVSLLYYLADASNQDRERLVVPAERGWRTNHSAAVAVWGRTGWREDPRKLKTLVHNLRMEIRGAGLDPWCLEKRRGAIRLRVVRTVVA
ncbi:MAG: FHA domain-containing protein [Myxococcota bacterium]